ncbi:MAG: glycosyltransferase [bacterium]
MSVSVIVPLFNEEGNVSKLYDELTASLSMQEQKYELIFVNDGSKDNTAQLIKNIAENDKRVKVLNLARNFGQSAAFQAGFDKSSNSIIVTMDGDLQNDPADIPLLLKHLENSKLDAVVGWRKNRMDPLFSKKIPSFFANRMISLFLNLKIHDTGCSLKAFRREILKEVRLYGEMHRFMPYLMSAKGYSVSEIQVNHRKRFSNKSKYGFERTFKVFLDMMTVKFLNEFSTNPIYVMGGISLLSFMLSLAGFILLVLMKIFIDIDMTGNPLLIISVFLFMIALQMLMLGLISEIQVRTYFETVKKDTYKIRDSINVDGE